MAPPHSQVLAEIVAHYRSGAGPRRQEAHWWADPSLSWRDACWRAAASRMRSGLMHDHQNRPGRAACERFAAVVAGNAAALANPKDFHDLLGRVAALGVGVRDAGELLVYDTADRLAHRLGIEPDRIYLHAGTRYGARKLGLRGKRGQDWIFVSDLPEELRCLTPREAEDLLCIYAGVLLANKEQLAAWLGGFAPGACRPRTRRVKPRC